jgi:hypothetical protein
LYISTQTLGTVHDGGRAASSPRDGDERHRPFAKALLEHIEEPGLEIGLLFRKVRDTVLKGTGGAPEPFIYGSLPSEGLYFKAARQ